MRPVVYNGRQRLLLFLKGVAMGAADVVPGVSGGTVAFITGIYEQLLASIRAFDLQALRLLFSGRFAALWQHINGAFLLVLGLGILGSVLSLANLISHLLEAHPIPIAAFFFGLILASAIYIGSQIRGWNAARVLLLVAGVLLAVVIAELRPASLPMHAHWVFLSGSLAICAMILPGISGSFILLLLGMYAPILAAIRDMQLSILLVFAAGCAVGLLLFSRVLHWLLTHYRYAMLAFLTGILAGSLVIVWPWKLPEIAAVADEWVPLHNVWPWHYAEFAHSQLMVALITAVSGLLLVLLLTRVNTSPEP